MNESKKDLKEQEEIEGMLKDCSREQIIRMLQEDQEEDNTKKYITEKEIKKQIARTKK